jgi:hypothetical protein
MPRKHNEDDDEYSNNETKRLENEINGLKKMLRVFKKEKNEAMVVEYKKLIADKDTELERIQFSLFAADMKQMEHITLHMPRQVT